MAPNCVVQFAAIQIMTVISYMKCLQDLRATVITISSFFIFFLNMKRMYEIFRYHGMYLSPVLCYYYVSDLSFFRCRLVSLLQTYAYCNPNEWSR